MIQCAGSAGERAEPTSCHFQFHFQPARLFCVALNGAWLNAGRQTRKRTNRSLTHEPRRVVFVSCARANSPANSKG